MNTLATVLLATAAVGGAGYVYLRWKAQQQQVSQCDALGSLIGDIAGTFAGPGNATANAQAQQLSAMLCNIADKLDPSKLVGGVVSVGTGIAGGLADTLGLGGDGDGRCDKDSPQRQNNVALNGAITESAHPSFPLTLIPDGSICRRKGAGIPVRHANGCVPYEGAPGWEKCAPGTKSLHIGSAPSARARATGTGRLGVDPLTVEHRGAGFPIPVPTGSRALWVRGQPLVCGAGQSLAIDQRDGSVRCWGNGTSVVPPLQGTHTPTSTVPSPDGSRDHRG